MIEKKGMAWTDEMVARLVEMRKEGRTFKDISADFGVSPNAIMSVWHRRVLKSKHPSREPGYRNGKAVQPYIGGSVPSVCYVPGLISNGKYVVVTTVPDWNKESF